jgi:hypothetical protein
MFSHRLKRRDRPLDIGGRLSQPLMSEPAIALS